MHLEEGEDGDLYLVERDRTAEVPDTDEGSSAR
jgi:hypothetical protein